MPSSDPRYIVPGWGMDLEGKTGLSEKIELILNPGRRSPEAPQVFPPNPLYCLYTENLGALLTTSSAGGEVREGFTYLFI